MCSVQLRWANLRARAHQEIAEENNIDEDHLEKSRGGTEDNDLVYEEKEKYLDVFS